MRSGIPTCRSPRRARGRRNRAAVRAATESVGGLCGGVQAARRVGALGVYCGGKSAALGLAIDWLCAELGTAAGQQLTITVSTAFSIRCPEFAHAASCNKRQGEVSVERAQETITHPQSEASAEASATRLLSDSRRSRSRLFPRRRSQGPWLLPNAWSQTQAGVQVITPLAHITGSDEHTVAVFQLAASRGGKTFEAKYCEVVHWREQRGLTDLQLRGALIAAAGFAANMRGHRRPIFTKQHQGAQSSKRSPGLP